MLPFDGKTALVTGGVSGIGYATVKHFLEQGIKNIAILDLDDVKNVTESLQSTYLRQKVVFIKTNVTKKDEVKSAFAQVVSDFKFVDFVVASAGILREKDYELTINVNLIGALYTAYTAIEFMSKENGGRGGIVVNIASVAGLDGFPHAPSYSSSKHGIVGLNKCLSNEVYFSKHGIKFITVCPGYTDTPLMTDRTNRLVEGMVEVSNKVKESHAFQSPESVGQCITETIILGKNGSVWIIDGGKKREVTLHQYFLTS